MAKVYGETPPHQSANCSGSRRGKAASSVAACAAPAVLPLIAI